MMNSNTPPGHLIPNARPVLKMNKMTFALECKKHIIVARPHDPLDGREIAYGAEELDGPILARQPRHILVGILLLVDNEDVPAYDAGVCDGVER